MFKITVETRESSSAVGMQELDELWFRYSRMCRALCSSTASVISIGKCNKLLGFVCKVIELARGVELVSKEPNKFIREQQVCDLDRKSCETSP